MSYESSSARDGSGVASGGKLTTGGANSGVQTRQREAFATRNAACIGTLVVYVFVIFSSYWRIIRITGGTFVYPLDDSYIHLAMAKNIVLHGVYGITAHEFSSSSSAPLWTLAIAAGFRLFGIHDLLPLVLTASCGAILLIVVDLILRNYVRVQRIRLMAGVAVLIAMPLPILVFSGMEHVLQTLLVIAITYLAAESLAKDTFSWRDWRNVFVVLLVALTMLVRFETIFLAATLVGLSLLRRRWQYGVVLSLSATVPCVALGIFSVLHGSLWLPNSVLLKGVPADLSHISSIIRLALKFLVVLYAVPHLLALLLVVLSAYVWRLPRAHFWDARQMMLGISAMVTLLHAEFAATGWVFRYEAYIVALSLVALSTVSPDFIPISRLLRPVSLDKFAGVTLTFVLAAVLTYPLAFRGIQALVYAPLASRNIFEQQYQMGRFVRAYYQDSSIAANDVGAINYLANVDCVDLVGLATIDIARKRLAGRYSRQDIVQETQIHHTKIAILYDSWFNGVVFPSVPTSWSRLGKWTVTDNFILGGPTVSFYAVDPRERDALEAHLRAFSALLPPSVIASPGE